MNEENTKTFEINCGAVAGRSPLLPCRGVMRRTAHNELEAVTRYLVKSSLNEDMSKGRAFEVHTGKGRDGIRANVRLLEFESHKDTGFTSSTCNLFGGTNVELLKVPAKRVTQKALEEAHKEAVKLFKIAYDAGKIDPNGPV